MPVYSSNSTLILDYHHTAPVALTPDRRRLDQGIIEGYAARYERGDNAKAFKPGCFSASIAHAKACGVFPALTFNCDHSDVVGRVTAMTEDAHGLRITAQLALSTERGSAARQELLAGIDGMSISFNAAAGDATTHTEATVFGISLMRKAAIPTRTNNAVRFGNATDFEKWLRSNGVAKNAARKLAAGGWDRLTSNDHETEDEAELQALARVLSQSTFELSSRR